MDKAKITAIISAVVIFVIAISIFGSMSTTITSSAGEVSTLNDCASRVDANSNALVYNTTSGLCDNTTTNGVAAPSSLLPLQSLFSGGGVVVMVLVAGILIFLVGMALRKR